MDGIIGKHNPFSRFWTPYVVWELIRSMSPSVSGEVPECQSSMTVLRHTPLVSPMDQTGTISRSSAGSSPPLSRSAVTTSSLSASGESSAFSHSSGVPSPAASDRARQPDQQQDPVGIGATPETPSVGPAGAAPRRRC